MLTKKQNEILDIIIKYIEHEGIAPTTREIGELAGLSSTSTVHGYLTRLEERGYITRRKESPRSIRVIKKG